MNSIEQEAIILESTWNMVDDMVNWSMFVQNNHTEPTNLMFETGQNQRLFIILLGDFLSQIQPFKREPMPFGLEAAPTNVGPADRTFLFYLRKVCAAPRLGGDATALFAGNRVFC